MPGSTTASAMTVAEIRPDDLMAGQKEALRADIEWLAARRSEFVQVACPACGDSEADALYEKYTMQHRHCRRCETQYISPRPTAQILGAFYAQSLNYQYWAKYIFPRSREARRERIFQPRAAFVKEFMVGKKRDGGTLIEVGAAHGLFCDEVRKTGLFRRIIAIEPTPNMAAECRVLGFETIEAPIEKVTLPATADVIASFEVIEHLFDPRSFLAWCHQALRPGGLLLLTCPNIGGFETLILGRDSDTVDHEHLNLFTPDSLTVLIGQAGFSDVTVTTPGELDVEIVRRTLDGNATRAGDLPPVLLKLLRQADGRALQGVLKDACLSSNMRLTAWKSH
jgi:SAM-dependent methyltransferase